MKTILLLAVFLAVAFGQAFTYKANSNVTLNNAGQFTFRSLQFIEVNAAPFYSGVYVASQSLVINPGSATFDGLYGAAYTSLVNAPTVWVVFVGAAANWNAANPNMLNNITAANVSAAEAFIGSTFISLDEVTPNGTVVKTLPLQKLLYTIADQKCSSWIEIHYLLRKGSCEPHF